MELGSEGFTWGVFQGIVPQKVEFTVAGPYKVPLVRRAGSTRRIEKYHGKEFFDDPKHAKLADAVGCYLFAIRNGGQASEGGSFTPWYVGKTVRGFGKECFGTHQRDHYNNALARKTRGTPMLFFVVRPHAKGRVPAKAIGELEIFLIQSVKTHHPAALNERGIKDPRWAIKRVTLPVTGQAPAGTAQFRRAVGWSA